MALVGVDDFGAGIYRGREAPPNAAYDLLNFLLDDEGQPYRRGGSVYRSNANAGATLIGLADLLVGAGRRTLIASAPSIGVVSDIGAVTMHALGGPLTVQAFRRWCAMPSGYAIIPVNGSTGPFPAIFGGGTKAASSAGTMNLTQGSDQVAGTGTSWLTTAEPGMIFEPVGVSVFNVAGQDVPVVKKVNSNTSLTLTKPWLGASIGPNNYALWPVFTNTSVLGDVGAALFVTVAGRRVLLASGQRVWFSDPDDFAVAYTNNYHQAPAGEIVGVEGVGDSAFVFTTYGMYQLEGLYFDPVDDVGNIQHRIEQINELILWDDAGVGQWRGAVVAPCVDDVWLLPPGGAPEPIGLGIRPLYRDYVKAGYQAGIASVHRGHYMLPILNAGALVDMLVCRLDRGFAWTRWSGHGAGVAYAQRIGGTTRSPKLFALNAQRVTDMTDAWEPSSSNASEADGTTHPIDLITRDLPTPGGAKGSTTRKARLRYEAAAAGGITLTVSYARGLESAGFSSLGSAIRGGGASDGLDESVWPVGKQAPAIRFRVQSSSALSSLKVRGLAAEYTPRGA
jgi:hypothetical protein